MSLNEVDYHLIKCLNNLHGNAKHRKGDALALQFILEEAIKSKFGIKKNFTDIVQPCIMKKDETFSVIDSNYDDMKQDLELDLFKEDLMCIVCNGMDVGARNRLLECSGCHSLYHQECHTPEVTEDSFENWVCYNCKETSKKSKPPKPSVSTCSSSSSTSKSTSSYHRSHSNSSGNGSYKSHIYSKSNDKSK